MHGNYAPNVLTNDCDVLIAIGMRFDDRVTGDLNTYAKQAKVLHLELDPAEVNKNVKADVALITNCKISLNALTKRISKNTFPKWLKRFDALDVIENEKVIKGDLFPIKPGITMGESIAMINKYTKGDAVIVTDVGQHQMVACRYAKFNQSKSNVTSGGLGTMGFALPAAIGAKTVSYTHLTLPTTPYV